MLIVSIIFILLIIVLCNTMLLHPKSRADVLNTEYSGTEDIWIKKEGNSNLLIMLHGMYSNPKIFEEFGKQIVDQGWDLYFPSLPNSAQNTEELVLQGGFQWEESLKTAFQKTLAGTCGYKKCALGGHSQGGSLALTIAPSMTFLSGLIIVAAPLTLIHNKNKFIRNLGIYFSGFLYFITPKRGLYIKSSNIQATEVEDNFGAAGFYYGITLHSMRIGLKQTVKNLKFIHIPCFTAYEKGDQIVHFQDFETLKKNISSSSFKEVIFETPLSEEPLSKRHKLFSYKPVKNRLFEEINEFLKTL